VQRVLARRIQQARDQGIPQLFVITGAGKHSAKGVPRIKHAAIAFLKAAHIQFRIPRHQDGALIVLI